MILRIARAAAALALAALALPALAPAALAAPASAAGPAPCGADVPCVVAGGDYRLALPPDGRVKGVYLFFHGYQGSAADQMGHAALVAAATDAGYAFAAADGLDGTWSHPGAPSAARDEFAYVGAVLDDLAARLGPAGRHVVAGGFSQGASMAWYAVCRLGDRFDGAVTFAGVFWNPLPRVEDCPAVPPPMIHVHGRGDRTFPLAGRAIGSRWHQGDTRLSRRVLAERAGCRADPAPAPSVGGLACDRSAPCARGPLLLCLHDGGHEVRPEWLAAALAALPPPREPATP